LALNQVKNTINLNYYLSQEGIVRINVFNARGILAKELYNGQASPGAHDASWSATVPGMYFVSVEADGVVVASRKVVVTR
jgi:hypothetical protein